MCFCVRYGLSGCVQARAPAAHRRHEAPRLPPLDPSTLVPLSASSPACLTQPLRSLLPSLPPLTTTTYHPNLAPPLRPGLPLCVYLLRYEDSFEMDRYQAALARERQVRLPPTVSLAGPLCCAVLLASRVAASALSA